MSDVVPGRCSSEKLSWKFHKTHRETPVLQSVSNNVAGRQACNFIKDRLPDWFFRTSHSQMFSKIGVSQNFTKFTGKHPCWSLLFNKVSGLQPANFLKNRLRHRCFSFNFSNFLKTPFWQNTSRWLFLCLPVNFSEHLFYRTPWGDYLFHVQVAGFQPAHTIKNYFTGTFPAFCTRTRRSY